MKICLLDLVGVFNNERKQKTYAPKRLHFLVWCVRCCIVVVVCRFVKSRPTESKEKFVNCERTVVSV